MRRLTQNEPNRNIRAKLIKLSVKALSVNLHELRLDNGFLDITTKAQAT